MIERHELPRLPPLAPEDWGEEQYAAYGSLLGIPGEKVPRVGSGHAHDPLNFSVVGTFVRHPEMARAFWVFNSYQLQRSTLPLRWRELSILRVAHRQRSGYEWGQHVKLALDGGITGEEIARLALGNEGFEGVDLLILEATDELLGQGRIGDDLWARIGAELDERQVMDLIFLVGTYAMLAMAFESWRLTPEADTAPLPPPLPPRPPASPLG